MRRIFFIFLLLVSEPSTGFSLFEPSIECTVIKVHTTTDIMGIPEFPKLYQSVNNDPLRSILKIAGTVFPGAKPKTHLNTDKFEKISILLQNKILELELHGKPISRNGFLKVDGKLLADVTCH